MAFSKDSVIVALMALFFTVFTFIGQAQAAESPAPSPDSPAAGISPSVVSACLAAFVALFFGSALRI